jgi:protein-S-isoprenylcysteine O-methyltransferase Ste14
MYIYFPQESRLVQASIYGVLRHPVYSGVLRVGLALVLWNGSPFALFAGLMGLLTMSIWVRRVEEHELIERFGATYRDYRSRTPAFFNLQPRTWPKLWFFLLTGK